jgi:iron(III) transport system ATP-binding protein
MSTTIDIQNLAKHYPPLAGGKGVTRAVDDISITIPAGSLSFLLGPSGCGKTTLLRMIAGFIKPTHGSISFNNKPVTNLPPNKRNTGMVFQSYALWPHMTVAQNVAFGLSVRKVSKADTERRVNDALATVRMSKYADRKPNQLSGGQQQRVALARALVVRPEVLLLDEPLSNLDAKLRLEMRSEIRRICSETGITTVYVTHDQKEALSMADHVAVLNEGRLAQMGTPKELYDRPNSRFVADFLGETNFLAAEITNAHNHTLTLEGPAGPLTSTAFDHTSTPPTGNVTCSIRPEAITIHDPDNTNEQPNHQDPTKGAAMPGTIVETIYLGEMAQHIVELKDADQTLRVFELHPAHAANDRSEVRLTIDPKDVVILTD